MTFFSFRRLHRPEIGLWLSEAFVAGACLFTMDGLAHLRLSVGRFGVVWAVLAAVGFVRPVPARGVWTIGGEIGLIALAVVLCNAALTLGITSWQIAYLTLLIAGAIWTLRGVVARSARAGHAPAGESLRLVAAGAVGLAGLVPFASDHFLGGTDAHWYGMMMMDFIRQARAGVFPVFVGQGESAFNGGVHPFRSAPWHMWLAGMLDVVTLRSLSVLALEHLTLLVSGVGATLAMYLSLVSLAPQRRWQALIVTTIFGFCPAQLAAIYASDAYMTYMTFPWIVVALYGNALTLRDESSFAGWWWVAVGSAMSWLAHPSVGVYVTIATLCLQFGWLVAKGRTLRGAAWGLGSGAVFLALTLYYFLSMTETNTGQQNSPGLLSTALFIVGVAALMAALWLWEIHRRGWGASLLGLGVVALAFIRPALLVYGLVVLGLLALVQIGRWFFPRLVTEERRLERVGGILLVAIFLAAWIVGLNFEGKGYATDGSLQITRETVRHTLAPVPADAVALGSFQAGWPVIALFAISLLGGFRRGKSEPCVFACTAICFVLLLLPIPYFAEFFWGNLPNALITVMAITFDRRIFPVLVPVMAFAGFLALGELDPRWLRRAALILLAGLLPWSGWEASKSVRRGYAIKGSWLQTKNFYRPDTFVLTRYAYDMLKVPGTLSHGIMDYRLESRILNDKSFTPRLGPDDYARAMEKGGTQEWEITGRTNQPGSAWLTFSPPLDIPPNQDWVMRFDFVPHFPPGYFILPGTNMLYREYAMPVSGYARSFGMEPGNHHVISMQNPTDEVQRYNWEYQRSGPVQPSDGEGRFARVTVSRFDPSFLPVRVTSLLPYRATLKLDQAGWLETFRSWIPGCVARVNGTEVQVRESRDHLVMLPVPAGDSEVELRFAGTTRLWSGLVVSAAAWTWILAWGLRAVTRKGRPEPLPAPGF
jgi:hypothetical protein